MPYTQDLTGFYCGPGFSGFQDCVGKGPFHVQTQPQSSGRFDWGFRESRLDEVFITHLTAGPMTILRSNHEIRECASSFFFVTLQLDGSATARQSGRTASLLPGDFTILDGDMPYAIEYNEPVERLILSLPKTIIGGRMPSMANVTTTRFARSRGIQTVFSDFLTSVASESHAMSERSTSTVISRLADLLIMAVENDFFGDLETEVTTNQAAQIRSMERYIAVHLADPELSPAKIASKHNISERYLQSLFEIKKVSVTKYIRDQRLDRCREELAERRFCGRTVSEICLSWGFNDPAYFTRAFKRQFDVPPGVYRDRELNKSH